MRHLGWKVAGVLLGLVLVLAVGFVLTRSAPKSAARPSPEPVTTVAEAPPTTVAVTGEARLPPPTLPAMEASPRPSPVPSPIPSPRVAEAVREPAMFPPPATVPPLPADLRAAPRLLTRAGGRLVGAIRDQRYYVRYEPQKGARLAAFDKAVAGRPFAFEIEPFRQIEDEPAGNGFHVERAGEIVAAALALQLDEMGYLVSLELGQALAVLQEQLGDRFKIDLQGIPLKATFSGDVRFRVSHARQDGRHETSGRLDAAVRLLGTRRGRTVEIYRRDVHETEMATGEGLGGASDRARGVAAAVVRRLVQTLLTDPRLEAALVAFVRS